MARFEPGRPIETDEDSILVEDLPLGRHVFRLVVTDRDGNRSVVTYPRPQGRQQPAPTSTDR